MPSGKEGEPAGSLAPHFRAHMLVLSVPLICGAVAPLWELRHLHPLIQALGQSEPSQPRAFGGSSSP